MEKNHFYYVTGDMEEELEVYYMQPLEMDASIYAYDNISVYYSEIDKLLYEEKIG